MRLPILLTLMFTGLAAGAQPIEPAQALRWQHLAVRAPESPGWVRLRESRQALALMRRSDALARSEVAIVSVFTLPAGLDRDGFAAWVGAAVAAEAPASRFRPLEADWAHVEDRGRACVLHRSVTQDLQARGLPAGSAPPLLQQHALYCRDPGRADSGFAATFSTRGPALDPSFAERAREFVDGVVPDGADAK